MIEAGTAQRHLRAIVALVLVADLGAAEAARTPDISNMLDNAVSAVSALPSYGIASPASQGMEMRVPAQLQGKEQGQAPAADGAVPAAQLPNGASAITETYGDWIVKCVVDNAVKLCTLSQTQNTKDTGQRLFAIELLAREGKAEGNMLMPFGLKLDAGAVLKLDGKDLEQVRFSTCTVQGCLLPVVFPTGVSEMMSRAKTLTIAAQSINGGQAVIINVPLNGFAAALDRTIQLGS
jgi:invasion protein IalB